jgi:nickel-type superoxide dismutase maturation protease
MVKRVTVEGGSMEPSLEAGDRLLFVRRPPWWPLRPGDVVAAADPRGTGRVLVKRVVSAGPTGVELVGDNPAASTDSRAFGRVPRRSVWGVASYRYAPAGRAGRLGSAAATGEASGVFEPKARRGRGACST